MSILLQLINGVLLGGMYALMALGLTWMFGVMRIVNFAYGVLFMLGAYIAYVLQSDAGLPFLAATLGSIAIMFVVGVVLEIAAFGPLRLSEERTVLLGLGLALLGRGLIISHFGSDNKILGSGVEGRINLAGGVLTTERLLTFGLAIALALAAGIIVTRTPAGRVMRAVADDPVRASLLGIARRPVYAITFGAATAVSAGSACLLATSWQVGPTIDSSALLISFAVVVIGGMGSMPGALVAGILTGVVVTLGESFVSQAFAPAMPFALLLLVLLFRPQGLLGKEVRTA